MVTQSLLTRESEGKTRGQGRTIIKMKFNFKKPPFVIRYLIIGAILVLPPILSAHYGAIYLGKNNGVLLGFCVGIICVSFACWKLFIDGWRDDED